MARDRLAVVVGASGGIGGAIARALHAQATAALEASALRDTRALRALADMVVNRNN
jgi:NADP-dependent 3-hydroxy acid dehydrogenase YdfG